jgi:hypothetical protein
VDDQKNTASSLIWAIALIIIVAIIAGTLYYGGFFRSKPQKHEIEVDINVPSGSNSR